MHAAWKDMGRAVPKKTILREQSLWFYTCSPEKQKVIDFRNTSSAPSARILFFSLLIYYYIKIKQGTQDELKCWPKMCPMCKSYSRACS